MSGNDDYISREAAIANSREYNLGGSYDNTQRAVPVDAINSIPAADVRPNVTGKFYLQYNGDGCWHCSECNYQARYPSNFCPNCGADMREES
ncbi:MAG: hypothetical protein IIZ96_05020 [Oscillospiraceae bacterium]|nr:hypothetical protein [Oscillospiraceae bacterium]